MDKFDTLVEAVVASVAPADQAVSRAIMSVVADLGRSIEQISTDLDRIACAVEKIASTMEKRP